MPLRTRLRRAFTRSSQDDSPLSKTSSKNSKTRKDSSVYQPGEKMPPPKYRRPVNPEHKEKLEAFSWAQAWRRKSDQSQYSPMGSRLPSRKNSIVTLGRRSIGGRKGNSRGNDGIGVDSGIGGSISGDAGVEQVKEGSDEEGDVMNVGLSRQATHDSSTHGRRSHSIRSGGSRPATGRRSGSTKPDTPFTQEELELALKKSHLEAPKEESDRSGDGSPGRASPGHASPRTSTNPRSREGAVAGASPPPSAAFVSTQTTPSDEASGFRIDLILRGDIFSCVSGIIVKVPKCSSLNHAAVPFSKIG
ncbi:hypothetical protein K469DRAFT_686737 [Zopfia rhizophila CBS 207.26]|uniref:Uncharacterized protein n=1 Tax=Zopfia rhizophila CBS 207.26 TaxID=1314779 RepID=A0A6A6EXX4_9PEZI|nr:hypothetical protein K469DRAFT_686737 [Zopfia rhizophila CBS 207.26]